MTGRCPQHNGSEGFSAIHPDVATLPEILKDSHGYRTACFGKVQHFCPPAKLRWDQQSDYSDLNLGRDPGRYAGKVADFLDEEEEKPFLLVVNSHDPHRPFHGSDQEKEKFSEAERAALPAPSRVFKDEEVEVPGFLPELPEVRKEMAGYASSCRRADDTFAAVMNELRKRDLFDDTIILFTTDHGMPFPFAKTNCYLHSTRTPLMVSWPGISTPGMDSQHMVSGIDILPTLLEGLRVEVPELLIGNSISGIRIGSGRCR